MRQGPPSHLSRAQGCPHGVLGAEEPHAGANQTTKRHTKSSDGERQEMGGAPAHTEPGCGSRAQRSRGREGTPPHQGAELGEAEGVRVWPGDPRAGPRFQGSAESPGSQRLAAAGSCHQLQPPRLGQSRHRAGMLSPGPRCSSSSHLLPKARTLHSSTRQENAASSPARSHQKLVGIRARRPKGITEQGGEGATPGPLHSSGKGPAGSSRGHGGGEIRSSLRLPTPNPFATFRLPKAIGSGRRKGVPRAGDGALEAQPKVGGQGCAEPKPRTLQTLSIPHCSRLPPAQRWTHARRAAGPRGLRSGGDSPPRYEDRLPPASPLWQLLSWLSSAGNQDPSKQHIDGGGKASTRLLEASSAAAISGEGSRTEPDQPPGPPTLEPEVPVPELGTWGNGDMGQRDQGRFHGDGDREVVWR